MDSAMPEPRKWIDGRRLPIGRQGRQKRLREMEEAESKKRPGGGSQKKILEIGT